MTNQDNLLTDDGLPVVDPNKNYLEELVGEGKKFKSQEDLARSKFESDQYIKILEKRSDDLRADYLKTREENTTRASLEELIEEFKKQKLTSNETPLVKEEKPPFDPKDLDSLVSTKIQEHEATKRQAENFNTVREKLQQRYGQNYKEAVKQQIEDLGITETELNEMARKVPKVLIKTLGLDRETQPDNFQSPPRSSQRNDSFAPTGGKKRTWAYYQELKKSDPGLYHDRRTAIQMQKDLLELGEAFQDGDYWKPGLHDK